jgi:hypothetical protein
LVLWLVAIQGAIVALRAIDWLADPRGEDSLVRVWLALTVWPGLEIEDVGNPAPARLEGIGRVLRDVAAGFASLVSGLALAALGQTLALPERGFVLDSAFKAFEINLLGAGGSHLLVAAFALAGYKIGDAFRYPVLAHSVLDFWSRYNVWIHRWLKRNIFEPIGRRGRRPVLGTLAVFAFSGLMHEYIFVSVARELLGWQLTFFGLHGLGAVAGAWLGRAFQAVAGRRVPRPLAVAATLGFVLATAPIFIHCLDRVLDFHRELGEWVLRTFAPASH